jgi:hypothetical protein
VGEKQKPQPSAHATAYEILTEKPSAIFLREREEKDIIILP